MRLPQATTVPAPQAPAAPQAPTTAPPIPPTPSAEQSEAQIHADVKEAIAEAKQAAHDAKLRAQQAREQSGNPEVAGGLGSSTGGDGITLQRPVDPAEIKDTVQNISYAFFLAIVCIAIGVPLVRALARRLGPAPIAPPLPREVADQLHRIEQTVESMAIEIERISESQRFLTKLGTGKVEVPAIPPRAGA